MTKKEAARAASNEWGTADSQSTNERLRLALRAGRMGTWEWDVPTGSVRWSPELEHIHGIAPGSFPGTVEAYHRDIHPDDLERVMRAETQTIEQESEHHLEYRIVWPDGSIHWVERRGRLFRGDDSVPRRMIGVCADITDRRRAETALHQTADSLARERERLAIALRAGQLGVYEWCVKENTVWWSPEIYPLYGVDPATFQPGVQSFMALVHPDDRAELWRKIQECIERREVFFHECRIVRTDGTVRWIANHSHVGLDADGQVERITGVTMDVTDRKLAEQRLGVLVYSIDDHLVTYDREWRFTFVNDAAARMLGRPREELLGRCIWEVFPGLVGNQYYRELQDAVRDQRRIHSEHYYPPFDRWFQNHIYPSPDGVTVFATDITARKKAEAALLEREEALREADRRKDEFLATLAHELRNPLAPIGYAAQILKRDDPTPAQLQWARDMIDRQVGQMGRLLDDLLDVARITRGTIDLRKERVELKSIVQDAVESSLPLMEQFGHTLSVRIDEKPILLDADPTRLSQVILNLLNNAARYTDPGGRITLDARHDGAMVLIRVSDSGIGIPADVLPHIFEMFAQGDRSIERKRGGLGIGLTLVRRLLAMHGGDIEARSDGIGKGSDFIVRLPAAAGVADRAIQASSRPGLASPRRRILVVDDNRDSAESMALYLSMVGHEVQTAHDGLAALERARSFEPGVILLDIGLPELNGYEVAQRIRHNNGRHITLIAITGWGQKDDRRRSREAGFDHHLTKPVDFDQLSRLLARR